MDLLSKLNSFRVNRDKRFDFPTPESPISTTGQKFVEFLLFQLERISSAFKQIIVVFVVFGHCFFLVCGFWFGKQQGKKSVGIHAVKLILQIIQIIQK